MANKRQPLPKWFNNDLELKREYLAAEAQNPTGLICTGQPIADFKCVFETSDPTLKNREESEYEYFEMQTTNSKILFKIHTETVQKLKSGFRTFKLNKRIVNEKLSKKQVILSNKTLNKIENLIIKNQFRNFEHCLDFLLDEEIVHSKQTSLQFKKMSETINDQKHEIIALKEALRKANATIYHNINIAQLTREFFSQRLAEETFKFVQLSNHISDLTEEEKIAICTATSPAILDSIKKHINNEFDNYTYLQMMGQPTPP